MVHLSRNLLKPCLIHALLCDVQLKTLKDTIMTRLAMCLLGAFGSGQNQTADRDSLVSLPMQRQTKSMTTVDVLMDMIATDLQDLQLDQPSTISWAGVAYCLVAAHSFACNDVWCRTCLRSVEIDGAPRPVRFFGMKGDLKWLSQVFKLPHSQL